MPPRLVAQAMAAGVVGPLLMTPAAIIVEVTAATANAGHQLGRKEMKVKMVATQAEVAAATMTKCWCSTSLFIKRLSKAVESHWPLSVAVAPADGSKLPLAAGIIDDGDDTEIGPSTTAAVCLIIAAASVVAAA